MKRTMMATLIASIALAVTPIQPVLAEQSPVPQTQKEQQAYAIGLDIARNMKRQGISADAQLLIRGFSDGLTGAEPAISEEQLHQALNDFQVDLKSKRARTKRVLGEENKKEGEAFLAKNKAVPGVVTLPSGLQYKVLKEGTGKKPSAADAVQVNYRGTLIDGTEFDNSYRRGAPATFPVKGVIPGWTEALQLMPEGSKWQLYVPSQLAYAEKGSGRNIGPNETLIFDVELLTVK